MGEAPLPKLLLCLHEERLEKSWGVQCSVFRVEPASNGNGPVLSGDEAKVQDFAAMWDGRSRVGVVRAVERLREKGLLLPVLFVGLRGDVFTVLVDALGPEARNADALSAYCDRVRSVLQDAGHWWAVDAGIFDTLNPEESLLQLLVDAPDSEVLPYLTELQQRWSLGVKCPPQKACRGQQQWAFGLPD